MNDAQPIDFVVTWVDGNDPAWRAERARFSPQKDSDARDQRYRDWDLMQYWFRGVEKFAPWVRTIHFVTWGHLPAWLNTANPRLHIVRHEDYIPRENLPLFNSCSLELYLHRIPGLAEHFVYFNDDFFCTAPLRPDDFFRGGKPRDMLALQPVVANPQSPTMSYILLNCATVLSRHFTKRGNMLRQPGSYFHIGYPPLYFFYNFLEMAFPLFTGFYTPHGPSAFLRSTFEDLWAQEPEFLAEAGTHRFRCNQDVSQYLFREWAKLKGDFVPANVQRTFAYFNVQSDNPRLVKTITGQKSKVVCINDANGEIDFDRARKQIDAAFRAILPDKCGMEK